MSEMEEALYEISEWHQNVLGLETDNPPVLGMTEGDYENMEDESGELLTYHYTLSWFFDDEQFIISEGDHLSFNDDLNDLIEKLEEDIDNFVMDCYRYSETPRPLDDFDYNKIIDNIKTRVPDFDKFLDRHTMSFSFDGLKTKIKKIIGVDNKKSPEINYCENDDGKYDVWMNCYIKGEFFENAVRLSDLSKLDLKDGTKIRDAIEEQISWLIERI